MSSFKSDSDGVIRLRTKTEIEAAHADSSLLMVGGFQRGRGETLEILGEFIRKEGEIEAEAVAEAVSVVQRRVRRKRSEEVMPVGDSVFGDLGGES